MDRVLVVKPEGKNHWVDVGVDGWVIIGRISSKPVSFSRRTLHHGVSK